MIRSKSNPQPVPALAAPSAQDIVRLIRRLRLDLSSEKHLQQGMATAFEAHGLLFEREKRLSPADIPDFFLPGGITIECKMNKKARKMDIYRQLERYAKHAEVTAIILASNLVMGLPETINSKPIYCASLSAGWL